MKIAVATNDNIHVTGHLGRCRRFIVYEISENKISSKEIRDNTFTHHNQQGEHHHHEGEHQHNHSHSELINGLKDCKVVIFQSGGWRVIEDLQNNNIKPFLTDESLADAAVEKYLNGTLEERKDNACTRH